MIIIYFKGKRFDDGKIVTGMSYSLKPFWDPRTQEKYILFFNPDYDLESQINYLKDPDNYSHLKDCVWKVDPDTVKIVFSMKVFKCL